MIIDSTEIPILRAALPPTPQETSRLPSLRTNLFQCTSTISYQARSREDASAGMVSSTSRSTVLLQIPGFAPSSKTLTTASSSAFAASLEKVPQSTQVRHPVAPPASQRRRLHIKRRICTCRKPSSSPSASPSPSCSLARVSTSAALGRMSGLLLREGVSAWVH